MSEKPDMNEVEFEISIRGRSTTGPEFECSYKAQRAMNSETNAALPLDKDRAKLVLVQAYWQVQDVITRNVMEVAGLDDNAVRLRLEALTLPLTNVEDRTPEQPQKGTTPHDNAPQEGR